MHRYFLSIILLITPALAQDSEQYRQKIKSLEERLALVEATLQTLLQEKAASAAPPVLVPPAPSTVPPYVTNVAKEKMPPELIPEIGKIDWRRVDFTSFSKSRNPKIQRYGFTPDAVLNQLPAVR